MKNRPVAIFDIDGTIMRSSLLIELVHALIAKKLFPADARLIYEWAHKEWLDRKGEYDAYIEAAVKAFLGHLKGVSEIAFVRIADEVAKEHRNRTYRYTRDLVEELAERNYFLLAISHSPKYVVDAFARRMKFDRIYGQMFEVDKKGKFTGKALHLDVIKNKENVVERALEKEGLSLKNSFGVGDTEADIPFLKMVETPICFNPNRKLYAEAKKRGWRVVVERKDMVYEL